jgi:hypothetical protein
MVLVGAIEVDVQGKRPKLLDARWILSSGVGILIVALSVKDIFLFS